MEASSTCIPSSVVATIAVSFAPPSSPRCSSLPPTAEARAATAALCLAWCCLWRRLAFTESCTRSALLRLAAASDEIAKPYVSAACLTCGREYVKWRASTRGERGERVRERGEERVAGVQLWPRIKALA